MRRPDSRCLPLLLTALFTLAGAATTQERHAHIGYVYPAGGARETTFTVTVGGQYLEGAREAFVSGEGVEAKVVRYWNPPSRGRLFQIARMIRELKARQAKEAKRGKAQAGKGGDGRKARRGTATAKRPQGARKGKGRGSQGKGGSTKAPPPEPRSFEEIVAAVGYRGLTRKQYAELWAKQRDPKRQPNPQIVEEVTLRITIDAAAPLGARELRLRASKGFSNPIAFHVGPWRETREKEPNDEKPDARIGKYLPVLINGQIMPGDVDRFSFIATKGMNLVAAAKARELIPFLADAVPGWFQATLALYDSRGRQVAYVDDFLFHPDPVLRFQIPADGLYTLEIRDAIYRGREDFVYRIALGQIPFVTHIFPLGGRVGSRSRVQVRGWNLPVAETTLDARKLEAGRTRIAIDDGPVHSNGLPFALDDLPETTEVEPNGDGERAQPVKQPLVVNGRIDPVGDRDVFRFKGYTGKVVVFEVFARRLGSPLDSLLLLTDAEGRYVASNDDHVDRGAGLATHHADSRLVCRLPRTGTYLLHLVDIQHKGGEEYAYRLHISRKTADYSLRIVPSSIIARPGQTIPMTAHALRRDCPGEIRLSLVRPLEGYTLTGAVIPAGADRVRFTLTVPNTPLRKPVELNLRGQVSVAGRKVRRVAVPAEDRMQAFLWRHLVPTENLFVVIAGRSVTPPPLERTRRGAVRLRRGGTTRIHFGGAQSAALKGVGLELNDPPKGVVLAKVATRREGGLTVTLKTDRKAVKAGLQGNLIFSAYQDRQSGGKKGQPLRTRRIPLGILPAIPFKVGR